MSSPSSLRARGARTSAVGTGLAAALLTVAGASGAAAQDDVRALGRKHGTVPPAEYDQLLLRRPDAFQFSRAWMNRNPRLEVDDPGEERPRVRVVEAPEGGFPLGVSSTGGTSLPAALGQRTGRVEGTFRFPVILGYYASDVAAPEYEQGVVQTEFFDGPNDRYGTVAEYYAEVSGGLVELRGETTPWHQSGLTQEQVAGGSSGLGGAAQVGGFILSLLQRANEDVSIDWGQYDNDGPDGIPNSGDDDGFVDVVAVIHPTAGAECTGNTREIWSHRWSLWSAAGRPFATRTRSESIDPDAPDFITVNDYTIQPLLDCAGENLNHIGVLAHELGHGFGLPDLYCTRSTCSGAGIGEWGLMGSGSWGCDGDHAFRPCHMSAWSKLAMGWAQEELLPTGADLGTVRLEPVQTAGRVLRYDIPGTNQYYLLENRQAQGFDADLHAAGLLVWHVDQDRVDGQWSVNRINADPDRYGVAVVEADAQATLTGRGLANRGDGGDIYPGAAGNTDFHAGSLPASVGHDGTVSGLTLTGIRTSAGDVLFEGWTRLQTLTLNTEGASGAGLLSVDGVSAPGSPWSVEAAPFQPLTVVAAGGEELEPGVRRPFQSWSDGEVDATRSVSLGTEDAQLTARYEGREVQVDVPLAGGAHGVAPGRILSDPASGDLWFEEGTAVTLTAEAATGFDFVGWTGALAGSPNPAGLVVDGPVAAGAAFDLTFAAVELEPIRVAAGDALSVGLVADNATAPIAWTLVDGVLPNGALLQRFGRLMGNPVETGSFAFTLQAEDAAGLRGTIDVTLEVGVPELELDLMAGSALRNGRAPSPAQVSYLDRYGNFNGVFDLGDIRSYLVRRANAPTLSPASGEVTRTLRIPRVGREVRR